MLNSTIIHTSFHPPFDVAGVLIHRILKDMRTFKTEGVTLTALALVTASIILYVLAGKRGPGTSSSGIPSLRRLPLFGHWRFFSNRYAFVNEGVQKFGSAFQFHILNHKVVAVSGERARKAFLNSNSLHFKEGYNFLHGSVPDIREIRLTADNASDAAWFSKRVLALLRKDRLEQLLPRLFHDVENEMLAWGASGQFDPLDNIYQVVFLLTARAGSCDEIASSSPTLARFKELFQQSEKATSASTVLLPWFPSRDRRIKSGATKEMFGMLSAVLKQRRQKLQQGLEESNADGPLDAMQVLIDEGCSDNDIIQFIMTTMFAGIVNTGIMSAWLIMYLGVHHEWKVKVSEEIHSLIAKYASPSDDADTKLSNPSTASRLSRVPPSVWEDEMPITELCLRETIRLVQSSVFLRRNVSDKYFVIDERRIEPGAFVVYPSADVHHNPAIYPDPERWDPARYLREEDKKQSHGYVGWGGGRHPCIGMRFAKLEVKCIMAMFLTGYDYDVVDKAGIKLSRLPVPDRNNLFERTRRPGGQPIYVRYTQKD